MLLLNLPAVAQMVTNYCLCLPPQRKQPVAATQPNDISASALLIYKCIQTAKNRHHIAACKRMLDLFQRNFLNHPDRFNVEQFLIVLAVYLGKKNSEAVS